MAEGSDPVKGRLSYTQFVTPIDPPEPPLDVGAIRPAIIFNVSGGPIRLLRAMPGERGYASIDAVLQLDRLCQEQVWPPPHTLIVNHSTYDYLAGLLTGAIMFPRRKDHG